MDLNQKIIKDNFGRKIKSKRYIYLPGSKYHEAEGYLKLMLCLQETFINYAPRIVKYINKLGFYYQCPTRRVKDKNMSVIENNLCGKSVINLTPVFQIER